MGARLALGLILVFAGVAKSRRPADTLPLFEALGFQSKALAVWIVAVLIVSEIVLGFGLVAGLGSMLPLLAASLLFAMFVISLCVLHWRGYDGSCACFGDRTATPVGPLELIRSCLLLSAALGSLYVALRQSCVTQVPWRLPPGVLLSTVGVTVALTVAWYSLRAIWRLGTQSRSIRAGAA